MSRKNALLAQRGPQGEGTLCRNAHEYVLKQRDRRQGLPHFRHLLWPKLGPILPLLLEQLQNSKCILSLRVSLLHNKNHFFLQDVDFVSPPAPTSSAGDGQRGFRLEYRQIPCSTWSVKFGIVKVNPPPTKIFPQIKSCSTGFRSHVKILSTRLSGISKKIQ